MDVTCKRFIGNSEMIENYRLFSAEVVELHIYLVPFLPGTEDKNPRVALFPKLASPFPCL